MLKTFNHIPLELPLLDILKRLGYNRHLTQIQESQRIAIEKHINDAFSLCQPVGRYCIDRITENDGGRVCSESGLVFESSNLAALLKDSPEIILLAGTVGREIVEDTEKLVIQENGSTALVYDAVGSETTDAILDWLMKYLATELIRKGKTLTNMRFSAGYGDLKLENQKQIFAALKLEELGLELNESYILSPEKSVTAIAGII